MKWSLLEDARRMWPGPEGASGGAVDGKKAVSRERFQSARQRGLQ